MMMGVMVLIGMGQVSGVITSQVLIQQQAPAAQRGSIIGLFGLAGAVGILFCSYLGGMLFDDFGHLFAVQLHQLAHPRRLLLVVDPKEVDLSFANTTWRLSFHNKGALVAVVAPRLQRDIHPRVVEL